MKLLIHFLAPKKLYEIGHRVIYKQSNETKSQSYQTLTKNNGGIDNRDKKYVKIRKIKNLNNPNYS